MRLPVHRLRKQQKRKRKFKKKKDIKKKGRALYKEESFVGVLLRRIFRFSAGAVGNGGLFVMFYKCTLCILGKKPSEQALAGVVGAYYGFRVYTHMYAYICIYTTKV